MVCMNAMPPIPLHRRLRVRHLELLAALGEMPSLHRASRALGMTQPAASKLLVEVEEAVGMPLFVRTQRGIVPTAAGQAFVTRACRTLGVLDGARAELQAIEAGSTGLVAVGVSAVGAALLVPRAVAWLRSQGKPLRVRIDEASSELLLQGLREGRLDCVIGRVLDTDDISGLLAVPQYDEPAAVVARRGHPLLQGDAPSWAQAIAYEWVLPPPLAPLRRRLATWLASQHLPEPPCMLESVAVLANVTVVRESDALAFLPGDVARHSAEQGLVSIVPITFPYRMPPVSLLRRLGEPNSPAAEDFCQALDAVCNVGHLRMASSAEPGSA